MLLKEAQDESEAKEAKLAKISKALVLPCRIAVYLLVPFLFAVILLLHCLV
jgi:hypothetical protein